MRMDLLYRYITGEPLQANEKSEVLSWINASEKNKAEYIELKNTWVLAGLVPSNKLITPQIAYRSKRIASLKYFRYAAVLLLSFVTGATSFYLLDNKKTDIQYTTIEVPVGERSLLTLADGSKVWLNSDTKLTYSSNFSSTNRKISFEGEAFFEVVKDSEHPFQITSSYGVIQVLGTAFNLKAYADMPFETTLIEGVVSFTSNDKQQCVLKPNQKLTIAQNRLLLTDIKPVKADVWKNDGFYFNNEDFKSIVKRLEKQYGVHIVLDEKLNDVHFSGQLNKTTLPDILQIINKTQPINYQFSADHKQIEITSK